MGSKSVLLPLTVAFLIFWLSTLDLAKSTGRFTAIQPAPKKP